MTITLDTTVGGEDSNAYCSIVEADAFIETNPHETAWATKTDAQKSAAIVTATRLLDEKIIWNGFIYDEDQALLWPRDNTYYKTGKLIPTDIIPDFLKNATAELARLFLAKDLAATSSTAGFKSLKVETLSMEIDKIDRPDVIPDSVFSIVSFWSERLESNFADVVRT